MPSVSPPLHHELSLWKGARVAHETKALEADFDALEQSCEQPLPASYRQVLGEMNGASFSRLKLFSVKQARAEWHALQESLATIYAAEPDWPAGQSAPKTLIPIGVGMDEQVRVLDTSTAEGAILLWMASDQVFVTVHQTVESWLRTEMDQVSVHYDPSGRPKPMRPRDTIEKPRQVILAHLRHEPSNAYANLLLAHWHAVNSPPEEALFAYRAAGNSHPHWPVTQYYHARWAVSVGRFDEARKVLRRCVDSSIGSNPRKNCLRAGDRARAHHILAELYDRVGQHRKALEQRRACQKNVKQYGCANYDASEEFRGWIQSL